MTKLFCLVIWVASNPLCCTVCAYSVQTCHMSMSYVAYHCLVCKYLWKLNLVFNIWTTVWFSLPLHKRHGLMSRPRWVNPEGSIANCFSCTKNTHFPPLILWPLKKQRYKMQKDEASLTAAAECFLPAHIVWHDAQSQGRWLNCGFMRKEESQ